MRNKPTLEQELAEARQRNQARRAGPKPALPKPRWMTETSPAQVERVAGKISKRLASPERAIELNERIYHASTGSKKDVKKYGVTPEEVQQMVDKQAGACAICGKIERFTSALNIDHCHATNRVRGLLCRRCNTGLGQFKDDPELLLKAIRYLAQ